MSGQKEDPEYMYTVAMIHHHCLHTCTLHPEPWNILTQMDGRTCCWSCISKSIYQQFPDKQNICEICYGFMKDWLELPLREVDVFFELQNTKNLKRIVPWVAKAFLKLIQQIGDLDERVLSSNIHYYVKKLQNEMQNMVLHEELLWATATLSACLQSPFADELKYSIDYLTDAHVCKDIDDTAIFTAFWFWRFWNVVPTIHKEHMGEAPVSYTGPALGMTPNNPNGSNTSHQLDQGTLALQPLLHSQQPWLLVEEEEAKTLEEMLVVLNPESENTV